MDDKIDYWVTLFIRVQHYVSLQSFRPNDKKGIIRIELTEKKKRTKRARSTLNVL